MKHRCCLLIGTVYFFYSISMKQVEIIGLLCLTNLNDGRQLSGGEELRHGQGDFDTRDKVGSVWPGSTGHDSAQSSSDLALIRKADLCLS